jgi:hypothetical protein
VCGDIVEELPLAQSTDFRDRFAERPSAVATTFKFDN